MSATDCLKIAADRECEIQKVPVRVQCVGFRCLAYRDGEGLWRDFITHEHLATVIGMVRYNLTELFAAAAK